MVPVFVTRMIHVWERGLLVFSTLKSLKDGYPFETTEFCLFLSQLFAQKEALQLQSKKKLSAFPVEKYKNKDRQEVSIEKIVRNKRKYITTVKGLDLFGVKLSDASKKLGKKFATRASAVKGPTEKEQIDIQVDISYDIVEFITETWRDVPEAAIFFIEYGKKVSAAEA